MFIEVSVVNDIPEGKEINLVTINSEYIIRIAPAKDVRECDTGKVEVPADIWVLEGEFISLFETVSDYNIVARLLDVKECY